ncbi:MAG TPA: MliC family protein [Devosiaceae bacterium]|jgi:membrane-bound inhibitor of C-type lysozyme|nr:MliC family protein [Devosiaceae bacterium]
MRRLRLALLLLIAAPLPAVAAQAPPTVEVGPANPLPQPAEAIPSAASAITITLGTTGDFERRSVKYGCEGDVSELTVDYINAAPNFLALVPIDGTVLVFNTVLSGSGAKYAAGKYVWWSKGNDASLYDLTQGQNAKPILTCSSVNETP